jgi:hypothetical protein
LSERLATPQWIGGALIIACVVILRMGEGRAPAPSALAPAWPDAPVTLQSHHELRRR